MVYIRECSGETLKLSLEKLQNRQVLLPGPQRHLLSVLRHGEHQVLPQLLVRTAVDEVLIVSFKIRQDKYIFYLHQLNISPFGIVDHLKPRHIVLEPPEASVCLPGGAGLGDPGPLLPSSRGTLAMDLRT